MDAGAHLGHHRADLSVQHDILFMERAITRLLLWCFVFLFRPRRALLDFSLCRLHGTSSFLVNAMRCTDDDGSTLHTQRKRRPCCRCDGNVPSGSWCAPRSDQQPAKQLPLRLMSKTLTPFGT